MPEQGNPHCCIVGEGSEREQCNLLSSPPAFSHFPHYPQINWALPVLIPGWVGLCTFYNPVGLSKKLSCEAGSFSCCLTSTGFYSQRLEASYSPCWNPGLHGLSRSPVVPPSLPTCKCGTSWSISCRLASRSPPATTLLRVLSTPAAHLHPSYQFG